MYRQIKQLLEWMEIIEDVRQRRKVRHNIKDILIIVLFATLANADTLRPENLQQLQRKWQELLDSNEGEKLKKIICVDGKTMRSNKREGTKPCHIVLAWSREDGYCLGQKAVEEKSNEITAIPKVLESIEIKGQVVTINAMGTQTAIVETIRKRRADYVLAVKGNEDVTKKEAVQYKLCTGTVY